MTDGPMVEPFGLCGAKDPVNMAILDENSGISFSPLKRFD